MENSTIRRGYGFKQYYIFGKPADKTIDKCIFYTVHYLEDFSVTQLTEAGYFALSVIITIIIIGLLFAISYSMKVQSIK